jgi:tetratricopeptide (TPR) repeat protein
MNRIWPVAALCVLGIFVGAVSSRADVRASTTEQQQDLDTLRAKLHDGLSLLQNNDPKDAKVRLDAVVSDPLFAWLPADDRLTAKVALGIADYSLDDFAGALPALKQAIEAGGSDDNDLWVMRAISAFRTGDWNDAVLSLTTVAQRWPDKLSEFPDQFVFVVARSNVSADLHANLLEALYAAKWVPQDGVTRPDSVLIQLVLARLAKGDQAGAQSVALEITNALTLARMTIDKRFDAIVASNAGHFDIARAAQQNIDDLRGQVSAAPGKLVAVNALAVALLVDNHPSEALQVLDEAIQRTKTAGGSKEDVTDTDKINWTENLRSIALGRIGRMGESDTQLKTAAQLKEYNKPNVDQAINLAEVLDDNARPLDALQAVASLDNSDASAYGRMQLQLVRACAYAQLNDEARLRNVLTYLQAHVADAADAYQSALLCANDIDGAAKAFIAVLDDPYSRNTALFGVQHFAWSSPAEGSFAQVVKGRADTMMLRPDVTAAIGKYGRVNTIPISPVFIGL